MISPAPSIADGVAPPLAPVAQSAAPQRSGRIRRNLIAVAAALLALGIAAAAVFWMSGGRWFVVRTPSMGTAAPVGSLVLTRPVDGDDLRVGQVIAFHPANLPDETYTHRIINIVNGTVFTRGDINGAADPIGLSAKDIVGRADVIVPGVGWLLRALPLLVVGCGLVWLFTRLWLPARVRGPVRLVGQSLVVSATSLVLRPWINVVQLSSTNLPDGTSRVTLVSTGLLPIRVTPVAGRGTAAPVDLRTGEVGVSMLSNAPRTGGFQLQTHLHLSLLGWVLIGIVWASPMVWSLAMGRRTTTSVDTSTGRHRSAASPTPAEAPA